MLKKPLILIIAAVIAIIVISSVVNFFVGLFAEVKTFEVTDDIVCELKNGVLTFKGEGEIPSYDKKMIDSFEEKDDNYYFYWNYVKSGCAVDDKYDLNKLSYYVNILFGDISDEYVETEQKLVSVGILKSEFLRAIGVYPWYSYRSEIKKVVIKEGITTIGDYAFYGLKNLESVTLPKSLESIGNKAFKDCSSMKKISKLPVNLNNIGEGAFEGTNLSNIMVASKNESFDAKNKILFTKDHSEIVLFLSDKKEYTIPDETEIIGSFAFCGSNIEEINFHNGVKEIGNSAFKSCVNLSELDLSNRITSIGTAAFEGCTNLNEIELPNHITKISSWTFKNCTNLRYITLPESVTSIGKSAFENCTNLVEIDLSSIKTVGAWAFKYCSSLQLVEFGEGLESIERYAFEKCFDLTEVNIPEGTKKLHDGAFYKCTGITKIKLPNTLDYVNVPFYKCDYICEVKFTGTSREWKENYDSGKDIIGKRTDYKVIYSEENTSKE